MRRTAISCRASGDASRHRRGRSRVCAMFDQAVLEYVKRVLSTSTAADRAVVDAMAAPMRMAAPE